MTPSQNKASVCSFLLPGQLGQSVMICWWFVVRLPRSIHLPTTHPLVSWLFSPQEKQANLHPGWLYLRGKQQRTKKRREMFGNKWIPFAFRARLSQATELSVSVKDSVQPCFCCTRQMEPSVPPSSSAGVRSTSWIRSINVSVGWMGSNQSEADCSLG